jgi:hypothetical protein
MLNTPMELYPAIVFVFLVFLHMFLGPAWFCIKPCSMVLHILKFFKRRLLFIKELFYVLEQLSGFEI